MRSRFDEQLAQLSRELTEMGALCEEVIALSAKALTDGDKALAARVAPLDAEIDQKERDIESLCLKLLLQQQPVARDLRQISAALKMITDMERIGDQAEDIAEIITYMDCECANSALLREMAKDTIKMVTESVDAYVRRDTELAKLVIAEDDIVDDYFAKVKKELIAQIAENPAGGEQTLDFLMIAKYFERIGDHALNILESAEELKSKNLALSAAARHELNVLLRAVEEIVDMTFQAFRDDDLEKAYRVEPLEQVIDDLKEKMRIHHILRMQQGSCGIEAGFIWSDLLTNLERVSDHCSNIACCMIEGDDHNLHRHEVLQSIRGSGEIFDREYSSYRQKYALTAE